MKSDLKTFRHKKNNPDKNFALFSVIKLAQMTFGQGHNTKSRHKQSLQEVRKIWIGHEFYKDQTDGQGDSFIPHPPQKKLFQGL